MSTATHEPLQTLIDDLWQGECQQAEEQATSLESLEEAMAVLENWSQRLEAQQAEHDTVQEAHEQTLKTERLEAEEIRKRLEHDLVTARERVADLQSSLQERTEELLKAQAANNELSAELQSAHDALPLGATPTVMPAAERAGESPEEETTEEDSTEENSTNVPESTQVKSVSDRFGRLRKKK